MFLQKLIFRRNVQNLCHRRVHSISKIRNIGLVAHIDAGKTTTTERILFYSGRTEQMGEVHDGDTVMDWMAQERERGITITSASASVQWRGHSVNLIDTPGHVDFGFEVERSLSALDGSVVILDAASGVQAQTLKVWQQANRHNLPRLFFVNKMDKQNANLVSCVDSIRRKLQVNPLLSQVPIHNSSQTFSGLIDVPTGVAYLWPKDHHESEHGKRFSIQHLLEQNEESSKNLENVFSSSESSHYKELLLSAREDLIGQLSDLDEKFSEIVLLNDRLEAITSQEILSAIRRVTIQQKAFPTLLGSAYKKIGIQQLLDSVINFLPNPSQSSRASSVFATYNDQPLNEKTGQESSKLCGFVFKNAFDKRLGALSYVRLYSGSLQPGQMVHNLNLNVTEKLVKIYRPFANLFQDVSVSSPNSTANNLPACGDICVLSGLNSTRTGDTLVASSDLKKLDTEQSLLVGVQSPDPVYYCSLESPSLSKMRVLEQALTNLCREDPSVRVQFDKNTNQIVLKGMGELHIDIIKDRIRREYGIEVSSGPLQVSYLESIGSTASHSIDVSKSIGGVNNFVRMSIEIQPHEEESGAPASKDVHLKVVNTKENNLSSQIRPWHLKWIQTGIRRALEYGPLSAFPVVNVAVLLHDFATTSRTSEAFVTNSVTQCLLEAMREATPRLLEPIMKLEIYTPDEYFGSIISDLSSRRAEIGDVISNDSSGTRIQIAFVPLQELSNYSTVLRTISSGMASFEMTLHAHRPLDEQQTQRTLNSLSGVMF